jgi:hypothetical protein
MSNFNFILTEEILALPVAEGFMWGNGNHYVGIRYMAWNGLLLGTYRMWVWQKPGTENIEICVRNDSKDRDFVVTGIIPTTPFEAAQMLSTMSLLNVTY